MSKILAATTHGIDDPIRCTLPFVIAVGALQAGKEVGIALIDEAVYLVREEVANTVHGAGFPPLSGLIKKVLQGNVPIYV